MAPGALPVLPERLPERGLAGLALQLGLEPARAPVEPEQRQGPAVLAQQVEPRGVPPELGPGAWRQSGPGSAWVPGQRLRRR